MKQKIIFLQGAFDLINWGHVMAFQEMKGIGDYVIIGLNSNELIKQYKKRDAVLPWEQKKFIIESFKFVDEVVAAPEFSPLKLLKKHDVDIYCLTDEWLDTKTEEIEYMKSKGGSIHILPRYAGVVPTSEIKRILLEEALAERQ